MTAEAAELQRGWAAATLRRYDDAIACARRALAREPENRDAMKLLAISLSLAQRWGEARPVAERWVALAPSDATAQAVLADVLRELGLRNEAYGHAVEAVRLDPESALAHSCLAQTAARQRRFRRRRRASGGPSADRAVALDPDNPATHNARGVWLRSMGRRDEAAQAFRVALSIRPDDARSLNNLAVAAGPWSNVAPTMELLAAASRADPSLSIPADNFAKVVIRTAARTGWGLSLVGLLLFILMLPFQVQEDGSIRLEPTLMYLARVVLVPVLLFVVVLRRRAQLLETSPDVRRAGAAVVRRSAGAVVTVVATVVTIVLLWVASWLAAPWAAVFAFLAFLVGSGAMMTAAWTVFRMRRHARTLGSL